MKLSNKRQTAVYEAIHDPIMDMRIRLESSKEIITEERLAKLTDQIWKRVATVLDIHNA